MTLIRFLAGNDIFMSNQTHDSILAHAVRHVLGLPDLFNGQALGPSGNSDGNNRMSHLNTSSCSDEPHNSNTYFSVKQIITVKKKIPTWLPQIRSD